MRWLFWSILMTLYMRSWLRLKQKTVENFLCSNFIRFPNFLIHFLTKGLFLFLNSVLIKDITSLDYRGPRILRSSTHTLIHMKFSLRFRQATRFFPSGTKPGWNWSQSVVNLCYNYSIRFWKSLKCTGNLNTQNKWVKYYKNNWSLRQIWEVKLDFYHKLERWYEHFHLTLEYTSSLSYVDHKSCK